MSEKIIIFDTTLRDGEQSPGASLNVFEKVEIANQLSRLRVDVIEAGFPASSPVQFDAVQRIAGAVPVTVAALCRAVENDIRVSAKALASAQKPRIHTFTSTSDIHIMAKFSDSKFGATLADKRKTILKMTEEAILLAKTFTYDVEYSAEDAGRTDLEFLAEILEVAIAAGATTVNIPDTTGYCLPEEFGKKIAYLQSNVKHADQAIFSVHCHNDLGLAVANSLSAVVNGARQVECTINGIGERAGNASLEEFVMALKTRADVLPFYTDILTTEITKTSRMVSGFTGLIIQPNKAIVGENAFAHESGIHQHGVLQNRQTYEIMTPESVGLRENRMVLGRHSGRHGLKARLNALGFEPETGALDEIYKQFLLIADKKKEVYDEDLLALMGTEAESQSEIPLYELDYLSVTVGTTTIPTATLRIKKGDEIFQESSSGDGPVDAIFKGIERALDCHFLVESYHVRSVTAGKDAIGEVAVRIKNGEKVYIGKGFSTDIIEASARAFLNALNHQLLSETDQFSTESLLAST